MFKKEATLALLSELQSKPVWTIIIWITCVVYWSLLACWLLLPLVEEVSRVSRAEVSDFKASTNGRSVASVVVKQAREISRLEY